MASRDDRFANIASGNVTTTGADVLTFDEVLTGISLGVGKDPETSHLGRHPGDLLFPISFSNTREDQEPATNAAHALSLDPDLGPEGSLKQDSHFLLFTGGAHLRRRFLPPPAHASLREALPPRSFFAQEKDFADLAGVRPQWHGNS